MLKWVCVNTSQYPPESQDVVQYQGLCTGRDVEKAVRKPPRELVHLLLREEVMGKSPFLLWAVCTLCLIPPCPVSPVCVKWHQWHRGSGPTGLNMECGNRIKDFLAEVNKKEQQWEMFFFLFCIWSHLSLCVWLSCYVTVAAMLLGAVSYSPCLVSFWV